MSRQDITAALNTLAKLGSGSKAGNVSDADRKLWEAAQRRALDATAQKAKEFIASFMQVKGPPDDISSGAGEPPRKRTGSLLRGLMHSVGTQKLTEKSQLVQTKRSKKRKWVKGLVAVEKDSHKAKVFMSPGNDGDTSKGGRRHLYSKYLQSGWVLGGGTGKPRTLPKGRRGDVPRKERKQYIAVPGRVQPPRPYMDLPVRYGYQAELQKYYRSQLRTYLPQKLQYLADDPVGSKLSVTYIPPFKKG